MTLAYRGTMTKAATLKQLRDHAKMDQIILGTYWTGNGEGKGCAVGCLTHDSNGGHDQLPVRLVAASIYYHPRRPQHDSEL